MLTVLVDFLNAGGGLCSAQILGSEKFMNMVNIASVCSSTLCPTIVVAVNIMSVIKYFQNNYFTRGNELPENRDLHKAMSRSPLFCQK